MIAEERPGHATIANGCDEWDAAMDGRIDATAVARDDRGFGLNVWELAADPMKVGRLDEHCVESPD
jgi:hypothetical protein